MAKEKSKLSLESLLRVRKVSLKDFLMTQPGNTVEEKISGVVAKFDLSEQNFADIKDAAKAYKKIEEVVVVAVEEKPEEGKRVRKKRQSDEQADEHGESEEKNSQES